jgi:hypothetical protein
MDFAKLAATKQWTYLLHNFGDSTGACSAAFLRDDGTGSRSIHILGTHATAAIEVAPAAGTVNIGAGIWGGTTARLHVMPGDAAHYGLLVQGAASQSAVIMNVVNNAGSELFSINSAGSIRAQHALLLLAVNGEGYVRYTEQTSAVTAGTAGSTCQTYMKGDKFVIQYDHGGTVKYRYLDLTSTDATWTYTTSAP